MTIIKTRKRKPKNNKQKKIVRIQTRKIKGYGSEGICLWTLVEKKKEETDLEEEGVQGNETVPVTKGYIKSIK